jgi:hypothetical protein
MGAALPEQMSWLGFNLLAGLPSRETSGVYAQARTAFVTLTVAGRRELYTRLPWHLETCGDREHQNRRRAAL